MSDFEKVISSATCTYWIDNHTKILLYSAEYYSSKENEFYVKANVVISSTKTRKQLNKIDIPLEKFTLTSASITFIDESLRSGSSLFKEKKQVESLVIRRKIKKFKKSGLEVFHKSVQPDEKSTHMLSLDLTEGGFKDIKVIAGTGDLSSFHASHNLQKDLFQDCLKK